MFSKLFKKETTKPEIESSKLKTISEKKNPTETESEETVEQPKLDIDYQTEVDNIDDISESEKQRINDELVELIKQDLMSAESLDELEEKAEQIDSNIGITDYEWETVYNNPQILGYENRNQQLEIFRNILPSEFNPYEDTLLDVGCGIGDLWAYCYEILKCENPLYTGIDMDVNFIAMAKKKYPLATFYNQTFNGFMPQSFDWIVAMSSFNEKSEVPVDIKQTIETMYENANKGIALNLMHTHLNEVDKESLNIFDPSEILTWALSKYENVKFHKNYINRDFYLCIYK